MDAEETLTISKNINRLLQPSMLYKEMLAKAQEEAIKLNVRLSDVKTTLYQKFRDTKFDRPLRNYVYNYLKRNGYLAAKQKLQTFSHEQLDYLYEAQQNWERRIVKSLNAMCTEQNISLARKRPQKDINQLMSQWTELGTNIREPTNIRPVYAPKDFLDAIISIQNQNINRNSEGPMSMWGIIQIALKVRTLSELRTFYSGISINNCQIGIDDTIDGLNESFFNENIKLGKKVIALGLTPVSQEYSKKGCPVSLRRILWSQMLGLDISNTDYVYYKQLKNYVFKHELLTDKLLYKDIKLTASNDDQYFVFEDLLYQVLLPFLRDTILLTCNNKTNGSLPKSYIRGKLGNSDLSVIFPPSGVIPFHGFSMYVVPFCYLYSEPEQLYFIFREMYSRFFFRLHCISSHEEGILSICLLFEQLLQTLEPEVFFHLKLHGIQPLRIAFKWIIRAFSGCLACDQVLLLWDRILAFDSLQILAVLAAAIFSFRKSNLMKVQSLSAAEGVFADLMTLQIIPLIQLALFSK
ncbi:TBC1 domain family member 19 [Octopus bimaculoides]|uniref:Rab-GAP TBC domain-containing protein n=1 Tax=Octopus bimaculoides TaxID=37653 RepID=A0A0L8FSS6_OCTBM|nr:TBC1 domain family member 19 [Octopus bimaculoides]|eukprot:XP_014787246.1 PREDICTED: TBC1 domain family member 19-like [Octopus bimaculoides]